MSRLLVVLLLLCTSLFADGGRFTGKEFAIRLQPNEPYFLKLSDRATKGSFRVTTQSPITLAFLTEDEARSMRNDDDAFELRGPCVIRNVRDAKVSCSDKQRNVLFFFDIRYTPFPEYAPNNIQIEFFPFNLKN